MREKRPETIYYDLFLIFISTSTINYYKRYYKLWSDFEHKKCWSVYYVFDYLITTYINSSQIVF